VLFYETSLDCSICDNEVGACIYLYAAPTRQH
jgi:hypothetical protein